MTDAPARTDTQGGSASACRPREERAEIRPDNEGNAFESPNDQADFADSDEQHVEDHRADTSALRLVLGAKIELFVTGSGQACIRLPPDSGKPVGEIAILRSSRVRGWMGELVWESLNVLLQDREIDRVINVLEGRAWQDQRPDLRIREAIEQDPVLEAVLLYMARTPVFTGTLTKLRRELGKTARQHGLDTRLRGWPTGSPQLSKRIGVLAPTLKRAGITVQRKRDKYERQITLKNQDGDDATRTASPEPSLDKSHHPKPIRLDDGDDGQTKARLLASISHLSEGEV